MIRREKGAGFVLAADAYQGMFDLAAEACAAEGIRQGLDDLWSGRVRDALEVFDELRVEYNLPR
jgi:hypothetical protein